MAAMLPDEELRRLHWRAHHRGTREADMMIGGFFDAHHASWNADDRALFGDLEETAASASSDERVAVRQALSTADVGAEKSWIRVGPDQLERHRIDLEDSRCRACERADTIGRDRIGEAVSAGIRRWPALA